jgi:hypothetical protein
MDTNGSQVQQLTNPAWADFNPSWSPDGKQIAWIRYNSDSTGQIMVMDANGANQHSLTNELLAPGRISWSFSGDKMAVDADLDLDGWIDTGWFSTMTEDYIHDICPSPGGSDCWLGGWFADDNTIVYSRVTFITEGGQVYIDSAALMRTKIVDETYPGGFPFHFSGYSSLHLNGDAQVLDRTLPKSAIEPISRYLPYNQVVVTWTGSDPGPAGVFDYKIFQKTSQAGNWVIVPGTESWYTKLLETGPHKATLPSGTPGQTLYFASQGRDLAENFESLPDGADAFTTTYAIQTQSQLTDNRGQPLSGISIHTTPEVLNNNPLQTDFSGQLTMYHAKNEPLFIQAGSFPAVGTHLDQSRDLRLVLAPVSNILSNGSFEDNLNGWAASGDVVSETNGHTGQAARLGVFCSPPCQAPAEEFVSVYHPNLDLVVDSQDNAHLLVNSTDYWFRGANGSWQHPDQPFGIPGDQIKTVMRLDNQDNLHVLYGTQDGIIYVQKPKNGDWQNIEFVDYYLSNQGYPKAGMMDVDRFGQVHVVYPENVSQYPRYFYMKRSTDGRWTLPLQVSSSVQALAAAPDGGAYLFYEGQMQHISPAGELESPAWLDGCDIFQAQSDRLGQVQGMCKGKPYEYRVFDTLGQWIVKHLFSDIDPWEVLFFRDGGAILYTMKDYSNIHITIKQPESAEFDDYIYDTGQFVVDRDNISMAVSPQSGLHIAASGLSSAFYSRSQVGQQNQESSLSQTVSIPTDMNKPTLSFLYQLQGPALLNNSGLNVTVTTEGNTSTNLFSGHTVGLWQHGWVDLSEWAGQTVTIRFSYQQAVGEPQTSLLLDEVSLAAWETPVLITISPNPVRDWASGLTSVTIFGANFVSGATILIGEQTLSTTTLDSNKLSFLLPGNLKPGLYGIKVISPSGIPSNPLTLAVGNPAFLPFLHR